MTNLEIIIAFLLLAIFYGVSRIADRLAEIRQRLSSLQDVLDYYLSKRNN